MTFDLLNLNIQAPTKEDIERYKLNRIERSLKDQNAFPFWFKIVEKLGVRSPKTAIIDLPPIVSYCLNGDKISDAEMLEADSFISEIIDKIRNFGKEYGYPIFLKNSFTSAKHYWKDSCFIKSDSDDIRGKMQELCNYLQFNTPLISLHLIAREFIKTDPAFFAFHEMPITEEYRMFAEDGKAIGWQPYWPEKSIQNPSDTEWKEKLIRISKPSAHDIAEMSQVAEAVTKELGGYWSVDFLKDKKGDLWLIDMAIGGMSFKCETGYVEMSQ